MTKKTLLGLLQAIIAAGLLAFLAARMWKAGTLSRMEDSFARAADGWPWIAAGMLSFGICIALCTIRWSLLIRAQGFPVPMRRLGMLYLVGHFFNTFLPGATGGDIVKAYYAALESPDRRAEAVTTVFIDRIIGLLGLILLTVLVTALRLRFFLNVPRMKWALAVNVALLFGTAAAAFVLFRRHLFEEGSVMSKVATGRFGEAFRKAYEALRFCVLHRSLVSMTLLISVINHLVLVFCAYLLGRGLNMRLPLADCLAIFPVINTISALPFTPSGFGTRENAAVFFLAALGASEADALSLCLLFDAAILGWGVAGGMTYIAFRPPSRLETSAALEQGGS